MGDGSDAPVAAVRRLREALEALTQALVRHDVPGLFDTEQALAGALADFGRIARIPPGVRDRLIREIRDARLALDRARRVGTVLRELTDDCLAAYGFGGEYDRAGGPRLTPADPAVREARLSCRA